MTLDIKHLIITNSLFCPCMGKKLHIFSPNFNPLNMDSMLIWTLSVAPSVSILKGLTASTLLYHYSVPELGEMLECMHRSVCSTNHKVPLQLYKNTLPCHTIHKLKLNTVRNSKHGGPGHKVFYYSVALGCHR